MDLPWITTYVHYNLLDKYFICSFTDDKIGVLMLYFDMNIFSFSYSTSSKSQVKTLF